MGAATRRAALARAGASTAADAARFLLTWWDEDEVCWDDKLRTLKVLGIPSEAIIRNAVDMVRSKCVVEADTCCHFNHIQVLKQGQYHRHYSKYWIAT